MDELISIFLPNQLAKITQMISKGMKIPFTIKNAKYYTTEIKGAITVDASGGKTMKFKPRIILVKESHSQIIGRYS